ncbi:MAG: glycosyltransferase family 2 protein [Armatimonadetes bacterium]|nr:glycosyltransferase family 2 protein [Armatimonadota bacterium]
MAEARKPVEVRVDRGRSGRGTTTFMNIVIPSAGAGRRFAEAGFAKPKPFIEIDGVPMIQKVVDNIAEPHDKVFILMRTDHLAYVKGTDLTKRDNVCFVMVDELTEGAACTVLRARGFIANSTPLLIANSDQIVQYDRQAWRESLHEAAGAIMTFHSDEPKWSYAQTDENGKVIRVAEKQVISDKATVGVYYFATGLMFVQNAQRMIDNNIRVNNEFYVCPVYNELISHLKDTNAVDSFFVRTFGVDSMYGLGTPEDFAMNAGRLPS